MGTSNFWRLNLCSNYWTFGLDAEEDDEFIYDDTRMNVLYELKKKDYFWETTKEWDWNNRIVWYFNIEYYNKEKNYYWEVKGWDLNKYFIIIEWWYYEGARFDIVACEDDYYNEDYINKTYEKKLNKIIKDIEKVFANYCTPIRKVAQFSNGETIYERV